MDLERVDPELATRCSELLVFCISLTSKGLQQGNACLSNAAAAKLYENLVICGFDGKRVWQRKNFASCSQESSLIGMK